MVKDTNYIYMYTNLGLFCVVYLTLFIKTVPQVVDDT